MWSSYITWFPCNQFSGKPILCVTLLIPVKLTGNSDYGAAWTLKLCYLLLAREGPNVLEGAQIGKKKKGNLREVASTYMNKTICLMLQLYPR